MAINKDTFCIVPFVQLNTRGKGDARVCCSIQGIDYGIPKKLTLDEINETTYNENTEVFNLSIDPIDDLWNSDFMRDFRMKMFAGEKLSNCEFCYKMESQGLGSKRTGKNKRFYPRVEHLLEDYKKENGYVNVMPQWWEVRLSTKCNLSCVMCSPNLSSMMFKEYDRWGKKMTGQMQGSLEIAKRSGEEYLSKSEFFKQQITDNLKHVLFMEFRGGEVFADRHSIDFIWEIARSEYAKNIELDISTNATLIDSEIVELLNCFKGGLLRFSIDAGQDKDELIRYHTRWDSVISSIENCNQLHDKWNMVTQTCLQALNCVGLVPMLEYFDNMCERTNNERFHLGFTSVRGKDWMRHELVPLHYRQKEIKELEEFLNNSWLCNKSKNKSREIKSINGLMLALSADTIIDDKLNSMAREYYLKLNELRNVDYWETFPHLEYLNE